MIKIGVVSDTHLNNASGLPKALIQGLRQTQIILHAGDIVSLSVLERLKQLAPRVYAVWGNMDPAQVKRVLPDQEIIQINNLRIGLTHGRGAPVNLVATVTEKFKNQQLDCIVYGHSHQPYNQIHQGRLYFNPGSATDKFFAAYNSYGILEADNKITGKIIKLP